MNDSGGGSFDEIYEALLRAAGRWPVCRPDDRCPKCETRRAAIAQAKAEIFEGTPS